MENSIVKSKLDEENSGSKELFKLVYRCRKLQIKYRFTIYVIYIASTRMIKQETDSLSRRVLNWEVLSTRKIRLHAPINLTTLERSEVLKPWLKS